jgi:hypothetical protein
MRNEKLNYRKSVKEEKKISEENIKYLRELLEFEYQYI